MFYLKGWNDSTPVTLVTLGMLNQVKLFEQKWLESFSKREKDSG